MPSARKRSTPASKLPATEELTRLLVEEVRDYAIFAVDLDNKIRFWNPGAEYILGFRKREAIGKSAAIIFTPEDRANGAVEQELSQATRTGRAEDERWHLRKNRKRFWASGVMTKLLDDKGKHVGFVKVLRDRTEHKRETDQTLATTEMLERRVAERTADLLEQQRRLRALALELTKAEQRERDAIAADLHDHLAQALAVCKMKLGLAGKSFPDGRPPAEYFEAQQCVQEVVAYSRALMYDLSPMVLGEGDVRLAIEWVAEHTKRHGMKVTVTDDGRAKPIDEDVLRMLYRAVQELLWNAVKYAKVRRATVSLTRARRIVRIEVRDRGAGFNPARQRPTEKGGFGLFSISERLAALGGSIRITSAPGKGTRVTLEAPLKIAFNR